MGTAFRRDQTGEVVEADYQGDGRWNVGGKSVEHVAFERAFTPEGAAGSLLLEKSKAEDLAAGRKILDDMPPAGAVAPDEGEPEPVWTPSEAPAVEPPSSVYPELVPRAGADKPSALGALTGGLEPTTDFTSVEGAGELDNSADVGALEEAVDMDTRVKEMCDAYSKPELKNLALEENATHSKRASAADIAREILEKRDTEAQGYDAPGE